MASDGVPSQFALDGDGFEYSTYFVSYLVWP
jgi:hypothetical protein